MKKKKTETREACLELIKRHAEKLPEKELLRVAALILESQGFICLPPTVVSKGKRKKG